MILNTSSQPPPSRPSAQAIHSVNDNILLHQRIAHKYDSRHPEIFNSIEQKRLRDAVALALSFCHTGNPIPCAIDIGCGTGNLSRVLLENELLVTACDVTPAFLEIVKLLDTSEGRLSTFRLNGENLAGIADGAYDFACIYSVLHHIPDYLGMVREMCRVLAPGGVLMIDHERNPDYWQPSEWDLKYRALTAPSRTVGSILKNVFTPYWYYKKLKRLLSPRWQEEGDIHVWPDDHIEWTRVEDVVGEMGFSVVHIEDYLHFGGRYPHSVHYEWKDRVQDMRLVIARKQQLLPL